MTEAVLIDICGGLTRLGRDRSIIIVGSQVGTGDRFGAANNWKTEYSTFHLGDHYASVGLSFACFRFTKRKLASKNFLSKFREKTFDDGLEDLLKDSHDGLMCLSWWLRCGEVVLPLVWLWTSRWWGELNTRWRLWDQHSRSAGGRFATSYISRGPARVNTPDPAANTLRNM